MDQRIVNSNQTQKHRSKFPQWPWVWNILLIGVLIIGGYLRFVGIQWDDVYHLHPDERFLTMVESSISPVDSLGQYFDTSTSSLNPNNRGYSYYVYGTLPLFLTRYVGEAINETGYGQIHVVGRILSGIFDLGTILLIYAISKRLYKNPRLGLMASLFYALSVLPIQLSHYFTVDTTATFFSVLAVYLAICIFTPNQTEFEIEKTRSGKWYWLKEGWQSLTAYVLFAVAYGMAMASKVSIAPLAILLPLAGYLFFRKLSNTRKDYEWPIILRNLVIAGILAFITFRIFQPYAFVGPSFFNFSINPQWISGLKELAGQSSGAVDVPYALQWVRRPITFAFTNMVKWGLGIPLGILAWAGFLWMAWRMIKGDWQKHILIWFWIALVFVTQSINWNAMMRYQIQIYPMLAIVAAWTIYKLWEDGALVVSKIKLMHFNWKRVLAVFAAIVVIAGTGVWAFAFSRIYIRPVTRVSASEWIYQNIPGAIDLKITSSTGTINEPVSYRNGAVISSTQPYTYVFQPTSTDLLTQITFEHALILQPQGATLSLVALISDESDPSRAVITSGFTQSDFTAADDSRGKPVTIQLINPVLLEKGKKYHLTFQIAEPDGAIQVLGDVDLEYSKNDQITKQYLPAPAYTLTPEIAFQTNFMPVADGVLDGITLNRAVDLLENSEAKTLIVQVVDTNDQSIILASGKLVDAFTSGSDPRGEQKQILLDKPVTLDHTHNYLLLFSVSPLTDGGKTALAFYNNLLATESSWDDAIPLGMDNYNVWDNQNGIYGNNKNFEMYWDDNADKLARFDQILNQADTIIITSNRQWGTITRLPERYPLSTTYYKNLIGCPDNKDILWCYQNAEPDMFNGNLGFKLTAVFESDPNIGSFKINDQSAEEAFTVYDHPKVLIFQKTSDYDGNKVNAILGAVDLTKVVHSSLQESSKFSGNLYLSDAAAKVQQSGGTWTAIFDFATKVSQNQWVIAIFWYLMIMLLGWLVYPFVRWALKGLPDRGYPLSRLVGLLLMALFTWLASSSGAQFNRVTILVVLAILLLGNAVLAYLQHHELAEEIKHKKRYFLTVELVFLSFFLIDLAIRLGNPDLWHPWKGGEKPMDLSYFTAVLKSTTFPPYDPWFAGGYINYYYYGFVIVGVPVKLLGITPTIAYNLILPTLFGLTAVGAFSVAWNILRGQTSEDDTDARIANRRALVGGLIAALFVLVIGNLGTLRMFWQGLQKLAAQDGSIDNALILQRLSWFFTGFMKFIQGAKLPFGTGDWYWTPSRAIPGNVITEFPMFTFLYADLHAHMISLPITILAIAWILSILMGKWNWGSTLKNRITSFILTFALGGVVIGALRPTNTWDLPVYLLLAAFVIVYTVIRYANPPGWFLPHSPQWLRKCLIAVCSVVLLVGLLYFFYLPFSKWYGQAYGTLDKWTDDHTPLSSYLVHWGFFFFIIISWFVWETREWLAETPVSALKGLKKYSAFLQVLAILVALVLILFAVLGISITWMAFPMAIWALLLLLRPGQSDVKKLVFFMIGTALVLTMFVELFALHGDIGRMNTVFKFYYQAWTLLALSSAVALVWLWPAVMTRWHQTTSLIWQIFLAILVFSVLLYPVTAIQDKVTDRMSTANPHTLDGMDYMETSFYGDQNTTFDLSQDYAGIKWMQDNVQGSPVIVEGNTVEYRWGTRYTIYTGLPGIMGWNFHQRQQRGYLALNEIYNRLDEITAFYTTSDINQTLKFLKTYNVSYIIVGQLERAYYPGEGLNKFEQNNGVYWKEVFRLKDTVIYEVIPQK
jgi:YYY domain-containing protein